MKKFWFVAFLAVVFLGSCNSTTRKLEGRWKVASVKTEFGKTKLPPEVIAHIVAEQKKMSFRIMNDSVLVLILNNNTQEARWEIDKNNDIHYYFSSQPHVLNLLGKWNGSEIVSDTKTPLGHLVVIYEKK